MTKEVTSIRTHRLACLVTKICHHGKRKHRYVCARCVSVSSFFSLTLMFVNIDTFFFYFSFKNIPIKERAKTSGVATGPQGLLALYEIKKANIQLERFLRRFHVNVNGLPSHLSFQGARRYREYQVPFLLKVLKESRVTQLKS